MGAGGGVTIFLVDVEKRRDDCGDHRFPLQAQDEFFIAPNHREDDGDVDGEGTEVGGDSLLVDDESAADGGPFSNGGDLKSAGITLE